MNQLFGREKDESAFVPFVQGPDRRAAGLLISSVIVATLVTPDIVNIVRSSRGFFLFGVNRT